MDGFNPTGDKTHLEIVPQTFAGHSLGGGLASAASACTGRPASSFNAAGLHPETLRMCGLPTTARVDTVAAYYVDGEVLSAMQDSGTVKIPRAMGHRIKLPATDSNGIPVTDADSMKLHSMEYAIDSLEAQKRQDINTIIKYGQQLR